MPGSDEELLAAVRGGDRRALAELVERHAPAVYRFATKMCREPEDAKDVLQDTLLGAARGLADFRGESSLSTWFYTVARSYCIKRRRTSRFAPAGTVSIELAPAAADLPDRGPLPDDAVAGRELARSLERAIAALEPEPREVLLLRDVEGLTAEEVSKVVGASVSAVKSRLHRARAAVRAALEPVPIAARSAGCPDTVQLFSRYLEGEIGASECRAMEQHLEACEQCRNTCDSLKHVLAQCRAAGAEALPGELQAALRRALLDGASGPAR